MPRTSTLAAVEIDVGIEPRESHIQNSDEPFRILVAGDFSGGSGRNRRPIAIDRDNFDQVLALLAPQLRLATNGEELAISFRELEDFHPDNLFQRLAPFEALRDLRKRLADRTTFPAAIAEIAPRAAAATKAGPDVSKLSGAELLGMMIGENPPAAEGPRPLSTWDRMLREITKPYSEPGPDPRQPEWIARTDESITGEMRALLHDPTFQSLESAWRGMHFLVRRVETGENLKIYLLDLPHQVLAAGGLGDLGRTLAQESWAAIAGLYYFGRGEEELLARIAGMAQEAGAPFIGGLAPEIVGLSGVFEHLRESLKANWLGLAMPRFLLRLPYGEATLETEAFAFEEMPAPPEHESYLWGHPALACVCLLAQAFERDGWRMIPGSISEIDSLPAHVYKEPDGESELKPCAEVLLTEDAAEVLLDRGFIPLASLKGTDRVRVVRFQSMAKPNAPLAGKWD
jgi:type VI secretion system protein ImpC